MKMLKKLKMLIFIFIVFLISNYNSENFIYPYTLNDSNIELEFNNFEIFIHNLFNLPNILGKGNLIFGWFIIIF